MEIGDLAADIANDAVDGDKAQIGLILMIIIGAIVSELVKWFFHRYIGKETAAKEFLYYYNNMGPLRRLQLSWRVRSEMKKHPDVMVASDKLTSSIAGRFKSLTAEDVIALSGKN